MPHRERLGSLSPRRLTVLTASALIVVSLTGTTPVPRAEESPAPSEYVCPPCGCGQDGKVSDKPGTCTGCRMKLIKRSDLVRVGILLFDGVQIIDYAAPWEVFGQAGFDVFTVSKTGKAITTAMGMSVNPGYSFQNSPTQTILLVPGGRGVDNVTSDPASIEWVRAQAGEAKHVLSVCNGAFILAGAGLLDNQKATTFYYLLEELSTAGKGIQVVTDQRYVDNGKVITSAGLSSGMDAALHLVSKIRGLAAAQRAALILEYDWKPDSGFARGALAEKHVPRLTGPDWEGAEMLSTAGDRERWESRYRMKTDLTTSALLSRVKTVLENARKWEASEPAGLAGSAEGTWSFVDDDGAPWTGTARVEPVTGEPGSIVIRLVVNRGSGSRLSG
ncbi:MAG TPA: DJ-1/PfpI family protein [Candidatus Polarisedimenticolia bacterium]|nr:DJ-1/PfpI family protein [Candidatus Polarisedimenticolia bacterium]